jgi:hypothetical protein
MRLLRVLASTVALALTGACACACAFALSLALVAGSASASGTTWLRSGSLHTQLASHVTTGQTAVPPELSLTAVNITATVVGTLALLSLAFVVVTLIGRRITS